MGNGPEVPAYVGVVKKLRKLIEDLPPGSELPSTREQAATFGANQGTVRTALEKLRAEGLVASKQGKGWFTTAPRDLEPDEVAEIMRRFDDLTEEVRTLAERVGQLETARAPRGAAPAPTGTKSRRRSHPTAP